MQYLKSNWAYWIAEQYPKINNYNIKMVKV